MGVGRAGGAVAIPRIAALSRLARHQDPLQADSSGYRWGGGPAIGDDARIHSVPWANERSREGHRALSALCLCRIDRLDILHQHSHHGREQRDSQRTAHYQGLPAPVDYSFGNGGGVDLRPCYRIGFAFWDVAVFWAG